jgi:ketosteroid isomerase-like protein
MHLWKALPVVLLLAVALPVRADPAENSSFRDAAAIVDRFHAALKAGDAADAASLLDEAVLIYEDGDAEHDKAQYVASHLPSDIAFSSGVVETIAKRSGSLSGMLAFVATEGHTQGSYHGRTISLSTTESMVLRLGKDGWRIVHIHWSSKADK